jgi:hypothetical protein
MLSATYWDQISNVPFDLYNYKKPVNVITWLMLSDRACPTAIPLSVAYFIEISSSNRNFREVLKVFRKSQLF